MILPDGDQSMT